MADQKISALTAYTTPIGADLLPVVSSTGIRKIPLSAMHAIYMNSSTAAQGAGFSTDTYLTKSNISIPSGAPYAGTTYKLVFDVTKTSAVGNTLAPIINIRIGTAGTTADTARCTFTFGVTTAAVDVAIFEVTCTFRTVGSSVSAVLQGIGKFTNNLATTGFNNNVTPIKAAVSTSAGFDSTTANSIIGASYNGGTSASHTVQLVHAELIL